MCCIPTISWFEFFFGKQNCATFERHRKTGEFRHSDHPQYCFVVVHFLDFYVNPVLPASASFAFEISFPSISAASKCFSGHAGPVNRNTAGAVMTTESPCGIIACDSLFDK